MREMDGVSVWNLWDLNDRETPSGGANETREEIFIR
jgi:hypothetical protein